MIHIFIKRILYTYHMCLKVIREFQNMRMNDIMAWVGRGCWNLDRRCIWNVGMKNRKSLQIEMLNFALTCLCNTVNLRLMKMGILYKFMLLLMSQSDMVSNIVKSKCLKIYKLTYILQHRGVNLTVWIHVTSFPHIYILHCLKVIIRSYMNKCSHIRNNVVC